MSVVIGVEADRDAEVRLVPCRVCGVPESVACDYGLRVNGTRRSEAGLSHLGRYRDARRAGLVPPIAGAR